jgi:hypothetical protein
MDLDYVNLMIVVCYLTEKESLSSEQRQDLLATINLDLVTETTLKKALESEFVSPDLVAQAALKLCSGLR